MLLAGIVSSGVPRKSRRRCYYTLEQFLNKCHDGINKQKRRAEDARGNVEKTGEFGMLHASIFRAPQVRAR
jgi:hypothetical protein